MFHCTAYDAIGAGEVTGLYCATTREIWKAERLDLGGAGWTRRGCQPARVE
ncbi:MAG: hypothetical protein ACE5G5_09160 [Candidatus Methylomirabilales bacterium]